MGCVGADPRVCPDLGAHTSSRRTDTSYRLDRAVVLRLGSAPPRGGSLSPPEMDCIHVDEKMVDKRFRSEYRKSEQVVNPMKPISMLNNWWWWRKKEPGWSACALALT